MSSRRDRAVAAALSERVSTSRLLRAGALALIVSIAVNLAIGLLAVNAFGLPGTFPPFEPLAIALFTTIGIAGAVATLILLNRLVTRPLAVFRVVAVVALVVSLIPNAFAIGDPTPMAALFPGASSLAFVALSMMHIATAVIVVSLLANTREE